MKLTADLLQNNRQKLLNAFPRELKEDVEIVTDFLIDRNLYIHPTLEEEIILDGQKLIIPGRVYFDNPNETAANSLTINQKTILNCIYLESAEKLFTKVLKLVLGLFDFSFLLAVFARK